MNVNDHMWLLAVQFCRIKPTFFFLISEVTLASISSSTYSILSNWCIHSELLESPQASFCIYYFSLGASLLFLVSPLSLSSTSSFSPNLAAACLLISPSAWKEIFFFSSFKHSILSHSLLVSYDLSWSIGF